MDKPQHQSAFTLAEILITLSIIGVVAALAIPSLIVKNQEKERIVQLKKTYNTLSNAYSLAEVNYGLPDTWGLVDIIKDENGKNVYSLEGANKLMEKLAPFLNIQRLCNDAKCFPKGIMYKYLNNEDGNWAIFSDLTSVSSLVLNDGSIYMFESHSSNCVVKNGESKELSNICGSIFVDVNGSKGPNTGGKDTFSFYISKYGIIPRGLVEDSKYGINNYCFHNGYACTAWVLFKENMNYLRGPIFW